MATTAFRLKTFPEILLNMAAIARELLGSDVDLEPGSVLRTILEACALQDADQYIQIGKLLDLFSIDSAKGDDLDQKFRDLGSDYFTSLQRLPAKTSTGYIVVGDGTLIVSAFLASAALTDATSFTVATGTGSAFASSGAVVLERGTSREEEVTYTRSGDVFTIIEPSTGLTRSHAINSLVERIATKSKNTNAISVGGTSVTLATGTGAAWPLSGTVILERSTVREEKIAFTRVADVLTLSVGTTFAHAIGGSVILSTNGSNRAISSGLLCSTPPTEVSRSVAYRTKTSGILYDGDFISGSILVESEVVGADTRVASNTITRWSSAPFTGATIYNPVATTRGADREEDDAYRRRGKRVIQSLATASKIGIEAGLAGVQDELTGQEVAFVDAVQPADPRTTPVYVYITDGSTSFALTQEPFIGRLVLISDAVSGDALAQLSGYGPYSRVESPAASVTPRLYVSELGGVGTSTGADYLEDTSLSMTVGEHVGKMLKTDDDQFFEITSNTAIRFVVAGGGAVLSLGSYAVFDFSADPLVPGTDFDFNEGNGAIRLSTPLDTHDSLVAASDGADPSIGAFTSTTGLGAEATRKLYGDPADFTTYPGLIASGTYHVVVAVSLVSPGFVIQVLTESGFTDDDVSDLVKTTIESYVNSLGIRQEVQVAEIIKRVKTLPRVSDVRMISPTTNFVVGPGQMARITTANVEVV